MTDILSPAPQTESSGPDYSGTDYSATASQAYRAVLSIVETVEPRIAGAIRSELTDQRGSLKLIASENYASPAVLLTRADGYRKRPEALRARFYAGCQNIDTVEAVAAEHARESAAPIRYAQPHSASPHLVAFGDLGPQNRAARVARMREGCNDLAGAVRSSEQFGTSGARMSLTQAATALTLRPNISARVHQRSTD